MDREITAHEANQLLLGTEYVDMIYKWLGVLPFELAQYRDRGYKFVIRNNRLKFVWLKDITVDGIRVEETIFEFDRLGEVWEPP